MSRPIPKWDNIEEVVRTDTDVQKKVLSERSLEFIRTRVSKSSEAPQLNAEGFRQIPNPLNWQIVPNEGVEPPNATPLYLEIPDDLHSIQTLRFLGFQPANAKKIFARFTSFEHENADQRLGFAELAKVYVDAAETIFAGTQGQPMGDINQVVILTQLFMGLDLNGDRLESIDPPERPIYWSTIKDWVIEVLDRRYKFLCQLDSAILGMEMTDRQPDKDEAARRARNRKKAEAKKAAKQRRKALQAAGEDEGQVEADDDQERLLEFAGDAEEIGGAQASKDAKRIEEYAIRYQPVEIPRNLAPFSVRSFFKIR